MSYAVGRFRLAKGREFPDPHPAHMSEHRIQSAIVGHELERSYVSDDTVGRRAATLHLSG